MITKSQISSLLIILSQKVRFCSTLQSITCPYDFKLYVYPLSLALGPLRLAEEARRNGTYHICQKCIYEQFALEYVIYDFFTQFCGRVNDPEEADFFYLPIVRDIEYRIALQHGGRRDSSMIEKVLLSALEKNDTRLWREYLSVTDKYWHRHSGADHIIVMPAPVTNLRHQTSMRGFFHYMIQLQPPIFLNVEFSRSFVREYPVCASEKNIVLPYPTTDPDLISGALHRGSGGSGSRDKLIFYHGGHHGECLEVRAALSKLMTDRRIAQPRGDRRREEGFRGAKYCPIPVGDSPSSKRMYDVMHFGCVPVILSDDLLWAYSIETGGFLNSSHFAIQLPQKVVQKPAYVLVTELAESGMGYLPNSGISLYSLLKEAAADDDLARIQRYYQNNDKNNNQTRTNNNDSTTAHANNSSSSSSSTSSGTNLSAEGIPLPLQLPIPPQLQSQFQNAVVDILTRVPAADLCSLQHGVEVASEWYRYYAHNNSAHTHGTPTGTYTHTHTGTTVKPVTVPVPPQMMPIPTSVHRIPDGGAIEMLAQLLSLKKRTGIVTTHQRCKAERTRPGHKYIGNYPCERDPKPKKPNNNKHNSKPNKPKAKSSKRTRDNNNTNGKRARRRTMRTTN